MERCRIGTGWDTVGWLQSEFISHRRGDPEIRYRRGSGKAFCLEVGHGGFDSVAGIQLIKLPVVLRAVCEDWWRSRS